MSASCCPPPGESVDEKTEREELEKRLEELENQVAEANTAPPEHSSPEDLPGVPPGPPGVAANDAGETPEKADPIPLEASDDPCDGLARRGSTPQVPGLADLFSELRERPQPQDGLNKGLVVCRIVTRGSFDAFKGPDLSAKVKFGRFGPKTIRGGEDKWTMHFSLPAVTVKKGQQVRVNVWDRDVFGSDSVGSTRKRFTGVFPFYMDHGNLDVECRAMGNADVEEEAKERLAGLDRILKRAPRSFRPKPKNWDWGLRDTALAKACSKLDDLEGYVGPEDERAVAVADRIGVLVGEWRGVASKSVAKQVKSLPAPEKANLRIDETRIQVTETKGGRVTVRIENLGDKPCGISTFLNRVCNLNGLALVAPDGRPLQTRIVKPSQDAEIAPGTTSTVTLRASGKPVLLRVRGWRGNRLFRLR